MAQPLCVYIALDDDSSSSHSNHARQLQGYLMPLTYMGTNIHVHMPTHICLHICKYKESVKTKRRKDT